MNTATPRLPFDSDVALPIAGRYPHARHASATGAQVAARTRGALAIAYVELLRACGPLSDHEAARVLGRQVSSINSTRNGLADLVVPSGEFVATAWGTRRVRWELKASQCSARASLRCCRCQ